MTNENCCYFVCSQLEDGVGVHIGGNRRPRLYGDICQMTKENRCYFVCSQSEDGDGV